MSILGVTDKLDRRTQIFDKFSGSLESIRFQADSSLAKDLLEQITLISDFVTEYDQEYGSVTNNDDALSKHIKIRALIEKEIAGNLVKIIEKHTGLVVIKVTTGLVTSTATTGNLYCHFVNFDEVMNTITLASIGLSGPDEVSKIRGKTIKSIADVSQSLDRVKGKILSSIKRVQVILNLPVGLFVVQDYMKDGEKLQPSPAEITAGLLHEIGHVFALIEYMADLSYTGYYGNNIIREVSDRVKEDPVSTATELIAMTDESMKSVESSAAKSVISKASSLLAALVSEITIHKEGKTTEPEKLQYKWMTISALSSSLMMLIFALILVMYSPFLLPLAYMIADGLFLAPNNRRTAGGRVDQFTMYERLADEYVSRHKMSKELNGLLVKITTINGSLSFGGPMFNQVIRDSITIRLSAYVLNAPSNIIFGVMFRILSPLSSYESIMKRLKRNISDLHDVLNKADISPEIKFSIINDIDEMEKGLRTAPMLFDQALERVFIFILRLPPNIIKGVVYSIFVDAGVDREYAKLLDNLDEVLSNKTGYHAARIKNIFDKGM